MAEYIYSDIKPRILQEIYDRLSAAFAGIAEPILIGGRAVNIYCYKNRRFTHDVDVVLSNDISEVQKNEQQKKELTDRLMKNGFVPAYEKGILTGLTDIHTGVKIDLYYTRDVSGIPIKIIADTAELKEIARESKVMVVNPAVLIAMKLNSGRPKDIGDIKNIIESLYKNPRDIISKESKVFKYIDESSFLNALKAHGIDMKEEVYWARRG